MRATPFPPPEGEAAQGEYPLDPLLHLFLFSREFLVKPERGNRILGDFPETWAQVTLATDPEDR